VTRFHLLARAALFGVVSAGVAAFGCGPLKRVGRWVAGAGGVALLGRRGGAGSGRRFMAVLRCSAAAVRCLTEVFGWAGGGPGEKDRRSCSQRGAMPGAAAACCWGDGMLSLES
jgi:hypothetical protein